jgi:hypothetical protein
MHAHEILPEKVGPANISECGIGCLINRKNPGFQFKTEWLRQSFAEGLRFFMFRDGQGMPLGFIEFVPGEFAWRPVDASGWLFVQCLWVFPRGQKMAGLGSRLVQACVAEARATHAIGVAAMVSDGPWMAGKEVFLKNGFRSVGAAGRFQLVIHRLRDGPEPRFRNISGNSNKYQGLHVVYLCPVPDAAKVGEIPFGNGSRTRLGVEDHQAQKRARSPKRTLLLWRFQFVMEWPSAFGSLRQQRTLQGSLAARDFE